MDSAAAIDSAQLGQLAARRSHKATVTHTYRLQHPQHVLAHTLTGTVTHTHTRAHAHTLTWCGESTLPCVDGWQGPRTSGSAATAPSDSTPLRHRGGAVV